MPRVLGLDLETTGLDHQGDHITELAWVVKEVGDPKPLTIKSRFCQIPDGVEIPEKIFNLTKITTEHCRHGSQLWTHVNQINADIRRFNVEYIVAHNGVNFDKPFLEAKLGEPRGELFSLPWVDTSIDIVYPEGCRYTNLLYVSAFYGFVNPFPHAAVFDVMTMLKVLDYFDFGKVVERSRVPWIVVKADVTYERRDLAKARRYFWENIGDEKFPRQWVKKIKEDDFEKEQSAAGFPVVKIA